MAAFNVKYICEYYFFPLLILVVVVPVRIRRYLFKTSRLHVPISLSRSLALDSRAHRSFSPSDIRIWMVVAFDCGFYFI